MPLPRRSLPSVIISVMISKHSEKVQKGDKKTQILIRSNILFRRLLIRNFVFIIVIIIVIVVIWPLSCCCSFLPPSFFRSFRPFWPLSSAFKWEIFAKNCPLIRWFLKGYKNSKNIFNSVDQTEKKVLNSRLSGNLGFGP